MSHLRPRIQREISFSDCDPFGHLYNVRYLDYFLDARERHVLDNYPLLVEATASRHANWVTVHNEIFYLDAAQWREQVFIESSIIELSTCGVLLEVAMTGTIGIIKALLWSRLRYVDLERKRTVQHPAEIQAYLANVLYPVECKTIKERSKQLLPALPKFIPTAGPSPQSQPPAQVPA